MAPANRELRSLRQRSAMSWPGSKAGNRTAGARFRLFPLLRCGSIAWSRHASAIDSTAISGACRRRPTFIASPPGPLGPTSIDGPSPGAAPLDFLPRVVGGGTSGDLSVSLLNCSGSDMLGFLSG